MPSTTRGSILISTANDIGEALVEKLGGVGYSPNEWKEKYNLCGIAPIDSAPALSVLADSAGTGDERGSILIATADAIGAILNKKYNVLRGFKPKEWASACRKMKALEEGSVASASIVSFDDGADDVPLKKCEVTLPASLDGYSEVNGTQTGRNLFNLDRTEGIPDPTDIIISPRILDVTKLFKGLRADNYFYAGYASYSISDGVLSVTTSSNLNYGIAFPVRVKGGATYCLSAILTGANMSVGCYDKNWNFISRIFGMVSDASRSFSTPFNAEYITVVFGSSTLNVEGTVSKIQLEVGNTATAYTPYIAPSSYTASLGRTIYGGQVDIVNGTGTDENGNDFTFDGQEIPTRLGYNAFWSDSGDTAVEYYQAPTPYARKTATGGIANFSDQRTDLPLTKAIANIAPSIAGKSAVNLYQGSEQYQPTTTYTAELGETVYGGSVDFVSGEVVKNYAFKEFDGTETFYLADATGTSRRFTSPIELNTGVGLVSSGELVNTSEGHWGQFRLYTSGYFGVLDNTSNFANVTELKAYLAEQKALGTPLRICYELATPTESTIPGRVISPIEGVNNYWNDAGGDTEIQYFENEA